MAALLYQIITRTGAPLTDVEGNPILFATRIEAERWLMPGERVEPVKG